MFASPMNSPLSLLLLALAFSSLSSFSAFSSLSLFSIAASAAGDTSATSPTASKPIRKQSKQSQLRQLRQFNQLRPLNQLNQLRRLQDDSIEDVTETSNVTNATNATNATNVTNVADAPPLPPPPEHGGPATTNSTNSTDSTNSTNDEIDSTNATNDTVSNNDTENDNDNSTITTTENAPVTTTPPTPAPISVPPAPATPAPTYSTLPLQQINILVMTDEHSWVMGHGGRDGRDATNRGTGVNSTMTTDEYGTTTSSTNTQNVGGVGGGGGGTKPLDADYGDILSFYQRLKHQVNQFQLDKGHGDLYFVMNGDFVHGTLLGADPVPYLPGVIERMPYDVITLGNHELNNLDTFNKLSEPGGLLDEWGDRLVVSNVLLNGEGTDDSDGDTNDSNANSPTNPTNQGVKYKFLHGSQGTILTLGFLFQMSDSVLPIEHVQTTLQQSWFTSLFGTAYSPPPTPFDAILILAHMDVEDDLILLLHTELRKLVGPTMVIQFVTGHTHHRSYVELDGYSNSFEAGRFFETVGFVSFNIGGKNDGNGKNGDNDGTIEDSPQFQHVFVDANRDSIAQSLGMSTKDYPTADGKDLSAYVKRTMEHAGANQIVGCAPSNFIVEGHLDEEDSLLRLYLEEVMPFSFLKGYDPLYSTHSSHSTHSSSSSSTENVLLQALDWFVRYDLFEGVITLNDVYGVVPEDYTIVKVFNSLLGSDLIEIWMAWHAKNDELMFLDGSSSVVGLSRGDSDLLQWAPSNASNTSDAKENMGQSFFGMQNIDNSTKYNLFALSKDAPVISEIMQELGIIASSSSHSSHDMKDIFHGDKTMRTMWIEFFCNRWPYDGNDCKSPIGNDVDGSDSNGLSVVCKNILKSASSSTSTSISTSSSSASSSEETSPTSTSTHGNHIPLPSPNNPPSGSQHSPHNSPNAPTGSSHHNSPSKPRTSPNNNQTNPESNDKISAMAKLWIVVALSAVIFFIFNSKRRGYNTPTDVGNDLELRVTAPPGPSSRPPSGYDVGSMGGMNSMGVGYASPQMPVNIGSYV